MFSSYMYLNNLYNDINTICGAGLLLNFTTILHHLIIFLRILLLTDTFSPALLPREMARFALAILFTVAVHVASELPMVECKFNYICTSAV